MMTGSFNGLINTSGNPGFAPICTLLPREFPKNRSWRKPTVKGKDAENFIFPERQVEYFLTIQLDLTELQSRETEYFDHIST